MPYRNEQAIFMRWLILVYLPLAIFLVSLLLLVVGTLPSGARWLVILLGIYGLIPIRALLETRRKGLALPRPPGAGGGWQAGGLSGAGAAPRKLQPPRSKAKGGANAAASRTGDPEAEEVAGPEGRGRALGAERSERGRTQSARALGAERGGRAGTQSARAKRPSGRIVRRRALAGVIGIGVLLLLGGVLVFVGIGRATSSLGLAMVGAGGFLMILSVTLPTFRLVDAILRGIGRLMSRRRPQPERARRSAR
ncbi:MAG: hypothetical protein ACT4OM_05555 [Actinomycetota bacterium]